RSNLRGADVPASLVPLAIDEFPVLFVAAANAAGTTRFVDIGELRHKESDRIAVMIAGLAALGVDCSATESTATITGGGYGGAAVDAQDDHRIAMSFAVAALTAAAPLDVRGTETVATSFPGFTDRAGAAGWSIREAAA
ncbi:MAG: bifunctional prephenate dehydrogenase/3-phosphoshikimate 1-carboxyvinyltransferase, partial [Pseudomonadota bacterium]